MHPSFDSNFYLRNNYVEAPLDILRSLGQNLSQLFFLSLSCLPQKQKCLYGNQKCTKNVQEHWDGWLLFYLLYELEWLLVSNDVFVFYGQFSQDFPANFKTVGIRNFSIP